MARLITLEADGSKGTLDSSTLGGTSSKNTITLGVSSNETISTGSKIQARIISPYTGSITKWILTSDLNTNTIVDVWKSTNGLSPTNTDSITGSTKPSLVAQETNNSTVLTGWNTTINEGNLLQLEIESNSASKYIVLQLIIE